MLVVTSEAMYRQSVRGAFASSTKYLRQSSWPYIAALSRSHSLPHQISFFLRRNISRCPCDHRMLLVLPLLFPSLAKVSLCRKEIEDSRGVLHQQHVYTTLSSSHGQSLEKQYFNISRLPLIAACSNRLFIPLAMFHFSRPLEKLEFVRCSNLPAKPGLIHHSSTYLFSPQGM